MQAGSNLVRHQHDYRPAVEIRATTCITPLPILQNLQGARYNVQGRPQKRDKRSWPPTTTPGSTDGLKWRKTKNVIVCHVCSTCKIQPPPALLSSSGTTMQQQQEHYLPYSSLLALLNQMLYVRYPSLSSLIFAYPVCIHRSSRRRARCPTRRCPTSPWTSAGSSLASAEKGFTRTYVQNDPQLTFVHFYLVCVVCTSLPLPITQRRILNSSTLSEL